MLLSLMWASNAHALDFKAGTYYFDNSKLKYSQVKMIVGSYTSDFTQVFDMNYEASLGWWRLNVGNDLHDMTYYVFACTDASAGIYAKRMYLLLDSISNADSTFRRTSLKSSIDISTDYGGKWVFCPLNNATLSDGYWRPDYSYNIGPSYSLPIVYLNTQDSATISTKEYYINGSLWIENTDTPLGSSSAPHIVEVKGRGNWTWRNSFKKPYKVKFASRQSPLGLEYSRHFILMAHCEDFSGYLRNTTGFEISRMLEMPYTPREVPVELVLNGEYMGLYFLCEKNRVEEGRVDIVEQNDNETDPYNATGGWLLELSEDGNIVIQQYQNNDPSNSKFSFITQSPEVLSQVQRKYIHDLVARADSCIFVTDKTDRRWEQILDINSLAKFYVIHEVMENVEAFSGSLFMYKDRGWDKKFIFGPVWDFDNSYFQESTTGDHFIFDYGAHYPFLWIKEVLKFPRFKQEVKKVWKQFCDKNVLDHIIDHAWMWRYLVTAAEQHDRLRWHQYASNHGPEKPSEYLNVISSKVAWLNTQWGSSEWYNSADVNQDGAVNAADIVILYDYLLRGNKQYEETCDVDGDGHITVHDLILVYNHILN
jgi:hypothetical protein